MNMNRFAMSRRQQPCGLCVCQQLIDVPCVIQSLHIHGRRLCHAR